MADLIRVWKEMDILDIEKHLLIAGDVSGDCSSCRKLGINYSSAKTCPECGNEFKYIASRSHEIKKIKQRRPDLIFIDFDDYKKATGKIKARDIFST
jgi:hypothetical protein